MGRPDMAKSPLYATTPARLARRAEVNGLVADWVGGLSQLEVLRLCQAGGVPCGPIYTIADIFKDPQYRARENLVEVKDPRVGTVTIPAAMPRMSETPARFRHTGRPLSADTQEILAELLHLDAEALTALRSKRVI